MHDIGWPLTAVQPAVREQLTPCWGSGWSRPGQGLAQSCREPRLAQPWQRSVRRAAAIEPRSDRIRQARDHVPRRVVTDGRPV